ncbi:MAG: hypothetical protein ABIL76_06805 [candidate division WOR-3 bacterium]
MDKDLKYAFKKLKNAYGSSIRVERITNAVIIYFKGYPIDTFHIKEFRRNPLRFEHWIRAIKAILRIGIEHSTAEKKNWSNFHKTRQRGETII